MGDSPTRPLSLVGNHEPESCRKFCARPTKANTPLPAASASPARGQARATWRPRSTIPRRPPIRAARATMLAAMTSLRSARAHDAAGPAGRRPRASCISRAPGDHMGNVHGSLAASSRRVERPGRAPRPASTPSGACAASTPIGSHRPHVGAVRPALAAHFEQLRMATATSHDGRHCNASPS